MAYAISKPRKELITAVDEIIRRVNSATQPGIPTDVKEYAFAAAIFLSHAEIENYFVDIVDRVARLYSNHSPSTHSIPVRLRAYLFVLRSGLQAAFGAKISGGDEQSLLIAVERSFLGSAGSMINPAIALVPFTGIDLLGEYSYPSIRNIEKAMRRLGIGDPSGALNKVTKSDVVALLESLASLRTGLAHSASLPGLSIGDLVNRLEAAKEFGRALDGALYAHTTKTHGDAAWQSEMP